jgi:LemA protein
MKEETMKKGSIIALVVVGVLVILGLIFMSSIISMRNSLIALDEDVNKAWAQVQNVYQRRADLIPNLVQTVKGYASHERETLQAVTEARAKLGGVTNISGKDLTPENVAKFQQLQSGLSAALQRLMVVVERYPDLKANQNFIRLQDELAGTENRIAVERKRFNEAVQVYNRTIRSIPQNIIANIMGLTQRGYFEAAQNAQEAPKVEF